MLVVQEWANGFSLAILTRIGSIRAEGWKVYPASRLPRLIHLIKLVTGHEARIY